MRWFPPAALLLFCAVLHSAQRPNILLIVSDDHARAAVSAYGGPLSEVAPTPNLDRIAESGALFTRAYCTNSICGPARAAMLTGKHSPINGYIDNSSAQFDGSQTTFPKLLQQAGYETAVIGKWHLRSEPQGFNHWEVLPGQGSYYNPDFIQQDGRTKNYTGYVTDIITERALDWLKQGRDPDRPFLLMAQHKAPHRNWSPALRHADLWDGVQIPEPPTLFDDYSGRHPSLQEQRMTIARHFYHGWDMKLDGEESPFPEYFATLPNGEYARMTDAQKKRWQASYGEENEAMLQAIGSGELTGDAVTRWKYQRYIKDYLRCIRSVDESVGELLDYLEASGLAENTIVIYTSDQGFFLGEHGWYDKRWMFEESFSMPLLLRWPGVAPAGSRIDALTQNIDFAPTLLESAGIAVPETVQGRSLLPLLQEDGIGADGPTEWREGLYYFYSGEATHRVAAHDGVAGERFKLIYFPETKSWNLFDLEYDPDELRSLHEDVLYTDVFVRMKSLYQKLKDRYRVSRSTIPTHRKAQKWWKERHAQKLKEVAAGGHELVFIGDSITQGWEQAGRAYWEAFYGHRKALNLGYSGDKTEHVLWRLLNGELEALRPKVFVLMIGTNNTGSGLRPAEQTTDGIRLVLDLLRDRSPDSEILLLPVFPREQQPEHPRRRLNEAINNRIKTFSADAKIHWLDVSAAFLDEAGVLSAEVMPDYLHPNQNGYRIWAEAIEPTLQRLLDRAAPESSEE